MNTASYVGHIFLSKSCPYTAHKLTIHYVINYIEYNHKQQEQVTSCSLKNTEAGHIQLSWANT